jgi:hypothetical protein
MISWQNCGDKISSHVWRNNVYTLTVPIYGIVLPVSHEHSTQIAKEANIPENALTVDRGLYVQRFFALETESQEYRHDERSLHSDDEENRLQTQVLLADVYVRQYLHGLIFDNHEAVDGDQSRYGIDEHYVRLRRFLSFLRSYIYTIFIIILAIRFGMRPTLLMKVILTSSF